MNRAAYEKLGIKAFDAPSTCNPMRIARPICKPAWSKRQMMHLCLPKLSATLPALAK